MLSYDLFCDLRQGWCYCDQCEKRFECAGWFDSDLRSDKYFQLHNNIRTARFDLGLSQTDLGKMTGLSQNTISGLETSQYNPSLYTAFKLSHAIGMPLDQLFYLVYFPRA